MIDALAQPSVLVVDDERDEYEAIIAALNSLYIPCVHFKGDSMESLPEEPFTSVRLVFMDLHLGGPSGKTAASHAANVFRRLVAAQSGPVLVVIWSKYADEAAETHEVADGDPQTAAEEFQRTLLLEYPAYEGRLLFVKMPKPKPGERPIDIEWVGQLQEQITKAVKGRRAISVLWTWEAWVREAAMQVVGEIVRLAQLPNGANNTDVENAIQAILQHLASAQGAGDLSEETAATHLLIALDQILADQVQYGGATKLSEHGGWLAEKADPAALASGVAWHINAMLLTAPAHASSSPFLPGTVYQVSDREQFERRCGESVEALACRCCSSNAGQDAWVKSAIPILVELSPECDVAQQKRKVATLMAGLVVPAALRSNAKVTGAFQCLPAQGLIRLRWGGEGLAEQDVFLVFCTGSTITLPCGETPAWLRPWFRLRQMPSAALRNWAAGQSARIGYVSLPG